MPRCEYLDMCPFFSGALFRATGRDQELKDRYCGREPESCARYLVAKAAGREAVGDDLYPDEFGRARLVIERETGRAPAFKLAVDSALRPPARGVEVSRDRQGHPEPRGPCELLATCDFLPESMRNMPALAAVYRRRLCLGDYSECARYAVFRALGRAKVPADLYPNDTERAMKIIDRNSS